jgi:hypothetical protein
VMKDGVFYKRPERQAGLSRWARSVA